jgi:hypothetical protein
MQEGPDAIGRNWVQIFQYEVRHSTSSELAHIILENQKKATNYLLPGSYQKTRFSSKFCYRILKDRVLHLRDNAAIGWCA